MLPDEETGRPASCPDCPSGMFPNPWAGEGMGSEGVVTPDIVIPVRGSSMGLCPGIIIPDWSGTP
jgi:hypothetical protein